MNLDNHTLVVIAGFILLALASKQIGRYLTHFRLPLISGFLLAGILFGPYGFGFIESGDIESLEIIDEVALAAAILVARSPSSAIAIINELRARVLRLVMSTHLSSWSKIGLILLAGYSIFLISSFARRHSHEYWSMELLLEPLLICLIAVIVLSQLVGPPLFKWAINFVGEAHTRHETPEFDEVNDAIIFGVDGQSLSLARQLQNHGWGVRVACLDEAMLNGSASEFGAIPINRFSIDTLRELGANTANAIVAMLSDQENYQIAELAYEHFGTPSMVVRLNDRAYFRDFHELGVLIVDPATVMVGLLDHFVRSPTAASLLVGMEEGQDVVEFEIRNKDLDGIFLRELRMPLDTLVLNVSRDGHTLISHGFTRLRCGDRLTVVGSVEGINELMLRFSAQDG